MNTAEAIHELADIMLDFLHYGDDLRTKRYAESYHDAETRLYDIILNIETKDNES